MHAVRIELSGKVGAIIQNEGRVRRLHDWLQRSANAQHVGIARVFEPQLHARDIAA